MLREGLRFLVFLGLTLLFRVDVWEYLTTRYLGGVDYDAGLYVFLARVARSALSPSVWFDTTAFYPYGYSLAWSDNFILPSLLFSCFRGWGDPLGYNLLYLLCGALNGYCAFRLFRLVGGTQSERWAYVIGVGFSTYGFLQQHYGHPQLQWAFWMPLGIELLLRAIFFYSPFSSFAAGLCISGAFLSSVYYAIFLAVAFCFSGILLILRVFVQRPSVVILGSCVLAGVGGLIPLVLVADPYVRVGRAFGHRFLFESHFFSANLFSYLAASDLSFFYRSLSHFSHPEARLFPGAVVGILWCGALTKWLWSRRNLCIALVALILQLVPLGLALSLWLLLAVLLWDWYAMGSWKGDVDDVPWDRFFGLLGFVFFFLSLGPLGNPAEGEYAPGLASVLYGVFPGFSAVRAVGRIGVLAYLFFFVGSLIGAKARFSSKLIAPCLVGLIVLDNWHPVVPVEGQTLAPKVLHKIANSGAVTIFLPLVSELKGDGSIKSWSEFSRENVRAMQWGQLNNLKVVNGYSGQRTMLMKKLPKLLADFPSRSSIFFLKRIGGLRYIVLRSDLTEDELDLVGFEDELALIAHSEGYYLFELVGASRLADGHVIRVPSWCKSEVSFEVKADTNFQIRVHAKSSYSAPQGHRTIDVSTQWGAVTMSLETDSVGVDPLELEFEIPKDGHLYLRSFMHECSRSS